MGYSLFFYCGDDLKIYHSNSWKEIYTRYRDVCKNAYAYIRDNEYGTIFKDNKRETDDTLLGWAGGAR